MEESEGHKFWFFSSLLSSLCLQGKSMRGLFLAVKPDQHLEMGGMVISCFLRDPNVGKSVLRVTGVVLIVLRYRWLRSTRLEKILLRFVA